MNKKWYVLFTLLIFLAFTNNISAQILRVGYITNSAPYVDVNNKDKPGIAIELWTQIANENKWQYRLIPAGDNIDKALDDLATGKLDVLLGGLSINTERMKKATFSQPYFIDTVGLITVQHHASIFQTAEELLIKIFNIKFFIAIILIALVVHIFWLLEKGRQLPKHYWKGIRKSFWLGFWSIVANDIKYDVNKLSAQSKIFSSIMLVLSLLVSSIIFGFFSSSFILSVTTNNLINSVEDIGQRAVAAIEGTSNVNVAEDLGLHVYKVKTVQQGIDMINANQVAGLVIDVSRAKAYMRANPEKNVIVAPIIFKEDEINIAFPKMSKLISTFNYDLLRLQSNNQLLEICTRYVGAKEAKFCGIGI